MAPEFAQMLFEVPEAHRSGFVFNPRPSKPCIRSGDRMRVDSVSKAVARIGKSAGVKVSETVSGKPVWASAHDLRRAFGFRWSRRQLTMAELMELMRHTDIHTTMSFYVGLNAESTADAAWKAMPSVGADLGASSLKTTKSDTLKESKNP